HCARRPRCRRRRGIGSEVGRRRTNCACRHRSTAVMNQAGPHAASRQGEALIPGVTRRELWAWAMYDFANSGYTTVVLTTVFSAYFVGVVAAGRDWGTLAFTCALSLSYLLVMLTMPALGARADARARRRRFLFISTAGCVAGTAM